MEIDYITFNQSERNQKDNNYFVKTNSNPIKVRRGEKNK